MARKKAEQSSEQQDVTAEELQPENEHEVVAEAPDEIRGDEVIGPQEVEGEDELEDLETDASVEKNQDEDGPKVSDESIEEAADEEPERPKKQTFLSDKLFKSKRPWQKQPEENREVEQEIDQEVDEQPKLTKAEISSNISKLQKSISKIDNQLLQVEKETQANQAALHKAEDSLNTLDDWNTKQRTSFFWKLKQKMSSNLTTAKSDLDFLEGQVNELDLPDPGTLIEMRTKFHKSLKISFLLALLPIFLLFFIPWAARIDLGTILIDSITQGWALPVFAILAALFSGIWFLIRRGFRANEKPVPWKKFWIQLAVIISIVVLISLFVFFPDFMRTVLTPILEQLRFLAVTLILIGLMFALLGSTISYYSKWSEFRRTVIEEYTKLDNVVNGYIKTKQEIFRLEGLYQQLVEWIEILAHAAYRPWKVSEHWKSKEAIRSASDDMPRALRVAQAIESDPADTARLESKIGELLLTPGWRSQAFFESLESITKLRGLTSDHLSVERLERDLPHQPNKSRELILESYRTASADEENNFLEHVARHRVEELASRSQAFALSEAQPKVEQLIEDPLRVLLGSQIEESSTVITAEWDDYLSRGLSLDEENQPPLSRLSFTEAGIMGDASKPNVFVLAPAKVAEKLAVHTSPAIHMEAMDPSDITPRSEIVLRIDVAKPTAFENVHLVSSATPGVRPAEKAPSETSPEDQDL